MPHRFYCPQLPDTGSAQLDDTEAHHLIHVLRHAVGDIIELFDGQGLSAECRIAVIRKRDATVEVLGTKRETPPTRSLILATSVPKGDRFDWLIEKATELGVARLIPITTQRSVVDPRASKLDKLRNTVIAACKQSGRNTLMAIDAVTSFPDVLRTLDRESLSLIAHPSGQTLEKILAANRPDHTQELVFIGPEGGFSEQEIEEALGFGVHSISLGSNILRMETAAIAIAARLLLS